MKRFAFHVQAVQVAGPAFSCQADGDGNVQDDREIRHCPCTCKLVQSGHRAGSNAPPVALIGHRRIRKTVAQDDGAFVQRRQDGLGNMLSPTGKVQQQFAMDVHAAVAQIEENFSDLLADLGTAGLACLDDEITA